MTKSYELIFYASKKTNRRVYIVKAPAGNISIKNLVSDANPEGMYIKNSGFNGITGSFQQLKKETVDSVAYACLLNIAYQDGRAQGVLNSGKINEVGTGLISYSNGTVKYNSRVLNDANSAVPKVRNSWAQGGPDLYFGYKDWKSRMYDDLGYTIRETDNTVDDATIVDSEATSKENLVTESNYRTAMIADIDTNTVYLVMSWTKENLTVFRDTLLDYFGLEDNGVIPSIKAILLDGGRSAQLVTDTLQYGPGLPLRKVPQIVAVV